MPKKKFTKPWNETPPRARLKNWVEKNEKRWYTTSPEDIAAESGASLSTVYRYYYLTVARQAKITPSKVHEKMRENKGLNPWQRKLRKSEIQEIIKLYYEGNTTVDIAFMTGRSLKSVKKYQPEDLKSGAYLVKKTLEEHKRDNPEVFGHIGADMTEEDIENAKRDRDAE